jgi:acyl-CoA hydrolase
VTVAVENVEFLSPVEVGELVSLKASINYVGNSTMLVGIRVESMNPKTKIVKHTNSSYFTMAAKDENNNLADVPGLLIENPTQLRRFCEGKLIKAFSKQKRDILKSDMADVSLEDMKATCINEKCKLSL